MTATPAPARPAAAESGWGALMTRERFVPDNVALLLPLLDAR